MKKVTSFVLALVMLLSGSVMAFAATDTAGTPYDEAVNALIEKGYVSGYPDGTYKPNNTISRAEAASILASFVGATKEDLAAATVADFSDMDTHKWAIPAVSYAVEQKILSGYPDGTFKPGNNVTYAELASYDAGGRYGEKYAGETVPDLKGFWKRTVRKSTLILN